MAGRTILQWDKDDLELLKIPKFDLLGLGMLTVIANGLSLVRQRHGLPPICMAYRTDKRSTI